MLIFLALVLPSCTRTKTDAQRNTLVIATQDDASTLDPDAATSAASMRMIENMYSTLLRYGQKYDTFVPDLATSIHVSPDQLTYTIHLRHAQFHSGNPVTAADVVFSIDRIIKQGIRSRVFQSIDHITTPNVHTVILHLKKPCAPLMAALAYPMNAIVDRKVVKAHHGHIADVDAGSGPFELVSWQRDQQLVLKKFDHYYLKNRPRLARVIYRPIPDETARTIALRTGQVDLMLHVTPKDIAMLKAAPDVTVQSVHGTFWEYLGFNCKRRPFNDRRVRQAVAWAVDRQQLNHLVKMGHATPLRGGNLPPFHWACPHLDIYPHRDLAKARKLLAAAGYPHGFSTTLKVGSAFGYQVKAAQVIKQQLRPVGIHVRVDALESSVFFAALNKHHFAMDLVGWVGFVDPDQWTWNLFHTGGKYNQQQYSNPTVDKLLAQGWAHRDRATRKKIYAKIERIIATDAPMVFLYVNPEISAYRDDVKGYRVRPTGSTLSLRDTYFAKATAAR